MSKKKIKAGKIAKRIVTGFLSVFFTIMLIGIITGTIMGVALVKYINEYIDMDYDIEDLEFDLDRTTSIYYMDFDNAERTEGRWVELEDERIHGSENRMWVSYDDIPRNLVYAYVAIEDERFFSHNGVDWKRTAGAILQVATKGSFSYGGSTITQQLIKNVTGEDDVKIQRKIQEIFRALSLEKKRDKKEILEMYLNTIYLSQGCNGVQAAANEYFGKDVSELTLSECASIAGITNAPTKYDPKQNLDENIKRRNVILKKMLELEFITQDEYDQAVAEEIVLHYDDENKDQYVGTVHSYFVDTVINDVIKDLMEKKGYSEIMANQMVFSGGLQIYTTMDLEVQETMESIFENDEYFPVLEGIQPECAMVVMNPINSNVLGIIGGRGEKKDNRGFNIATDAMRQPGSSIKPLSVYSIALEQGLIAYTGVMDDSPFRLNEYTDKMWPTNTPNAFRGNTMIYDAVARSINTIPVKLIDAMGTDFVFEFLTEKYHLSTLVDRLEHSNGNVYSDIDYAPLALGGFTYGVTLMDMTAAYTVFAADGVYTEPRTYIKVLDSNGNVILSNEPQRNVVISEDTAQVMTKILQGVVDLSVGTARKVTLKEYVDVAAKTGTTNDNKDIYFMGYTPYLVGGVWFGYEQPRYLPSFTSSPSLYIWDVVMTELHRDIIADDAAGIEEIKTFDYSNLVTCEICKDSGMLIGEYCNLDPRGNRASTGYYTLSTAPTETCNVHVPVKWDVTTKSVAGPGCREDYLVTIALVKNENRSFEKTTYIWDAEYTYMDLPEGYLYPSETDQPFYINLYLDGNTPGYTANVSRPTNSFCVEHNPEMTTSWAQLCYEYSLAHPEEESNNES